MPVPAHLVRRIRGLTVSYFHADLKDGVGDREVLKISRKVGARIESACIPRDDMWRVVEPDWQTAQIPRMCEQLYGTVSKAGCAKVWHAVMEGIEDLHRYPPVSTGNINDELEKMAREGMIISKNGVPLNA